MEWFYFGVGLTLGGTLATLAWLVEIRPNVTFLRKAKSYRCLLKSSRVTDAPDADVAFRSEFRIELIGVDTPSPRKRWATYGVHGVQTRDKKHGSWYSQRRAVNEAAEFQPGREYDCWVLEQPSITAMTRRTTWWMSWTFGLFGFVLLLLCLLWILGAVTVTPQP